MTSSTGRPSHTTTEIRARLPPVRRKSKNSTRALSARCRRSSGRANAAGIHRPIMVDECSRLRPAPATSRSTHARRGGHSHAILHDPPGGRLLVSTSSARAAAAPKHACGAGFSPELVRAHGNSPASQALRRRAAQLSISSSRTWAVLMQIDTPPRLHLQGRRAARHADAPSHGDPASNCSRARRRGPPLCSPRMPTTSCP